MPPWCLKPCPATGCAGRPLQVLALNQPTNLDVWRDRGVMAVSLRRHMQRLDQSYHPWRPISTTLLLEALSSDRGC